MNDRFRERLFCLSEQLDSPIRSASPQGSRSPRRASRSPRPHKLDPPLIVHDSRPNIAAWPAPPQQHSLAQSQQHPPPPTAPTNNSSPALSPNNNSRGSYDDVQEPNAFLSFLRVAAGTGIRSPYLDLVDATGQPRGREKELKKKIETLEDKVAEYERQKYNVMGTFTEYRERVAEREKKLEAEYSNKIIALSEEVLGAKKDFEARMKSFQALQDKFEREKEQALEKLRQEHQKEIQILEQRFNDSQLLNLEQKYLIEVQRLEDERKSLRAEKERLGETFEMKLRRAQSLYETELSAAKMLYTKELEALRDHEEALKEELLARQDEFHDRLQELQHQAKQSRDELAMCKNEVTALEQKLHSKEAEVIAISQELEEARNETNDSLRRLSHIQTELEETKSNHQEHEEELRKKSNLLEVVEAAKKKLEAMIRDLQNEVKNMKNKVAFLEKERENLQSQSESQTQLQNSQVHALEAVLESVTKEKEATKEHYENLLTKERQQSEAREMSMKREYTSKLNQIEEQYTALKEDLEQSAKLDKDELRESTHQEIENLRVERDLLASQVSALTAKFIDETNDEDAIASQIASMVRDTERLQKSLEDAKERLTTKDSEIASMRKRLEQEHQVTEDQISVIREEIRLELTSQDTYAKHNEEIEELHAKAAELEVQCENQAQMLEDEQERRREQEMENESLKATIEKLTKELEEKASGSFDEDELRERIEAEVAEKLRQQYDSEFEKEKELWEAEKAKLTGTISGLEEEQQSSTKNLEELKSKCDDLMREMTDLKVEVSKKNEEIKNIGMTNEEYKRGVEHNKLVETETKLKEVVEEHEQAIAAMNDHQRDLEKKIRQLEESLSMKEQELQERLKADEDEEEEEEEESEGPELVEADMQTDEIERPAPIQIVDLAREKELKAQVENLEQTLEQRNQQIAELQVRINAQKDVLGQEKLEICHQEEEAAKKKDRSQSVGGEQAAKCQKATTKFERLVNSMTEKKEKKEEKAASKAEKKAKEAQAAAAKEKSPALARSKSPSLLTRLRDRSPKAKSPSIDITPASSSRNLLSPSDAEHMHDRKGSPSRPLFSRSKKEKEQPLTPNSEKRPAWKF